MRDSMPRAKALGNEAIWMMCACIVLSVYVQVFTSPLGLVTTCLVAMLSLGDYHSMHHFL